MAIIWNNCSCGDVPRPWNSPTFNQSGTRGPTGPTGTSITLWSGSYSEYKAISYKDPNTLYLITDFSNI